MVHLRLNDPDTSRNPYINYITSLPSYPDHEEAHRRLQQLAALFKPIMKKHGLQINSFEEYEPNPEFSGRNWNAGENIELVLRRRGTRKGEGGGGGWLPFPLLCYVFSHELAHSFEMNHSSRHAAWTKTFSQECRELQAKGYYGDGLWSAGRRLSDAEWCQGSSDLGGTAVPSSLCGGAWKKGKGKGRAAGGKRKRSGPGGIPAAGTSRKKGTPSLHTGAQTARNTELTAGKRRAYVALPGAGSRVDGRDYIPRATAKSQEYKLDENSTFRRRANTNAARDLRAAATLRRINALQAGASGTKDEKDEGKDQRDSKEIKSGSSSHLPSLGVFDQADDHEFDATTSEATSNKSDEEEYSETEDEQEEADDGGLYDSATDDEADDSAFACGSAGPSSAGGADSKVPAHSNTSGDDTAATTSSGPALAQLQQQTVSSSETDAQRQRRMERYRQSLQVERAHNAKQGGKQASGSGSGSGSRSRSAPGGSAAIGEDEEWQTALKDVQRLGASQRRMDALQRASSTQVDSGDREAGSGHTPLKSESSDRSGEDKKPKTLSLSASARSTPSAAAQKKPSNTGKKGSGGVLLGGGGGGNGPGGAGSGVSRLLSLQPAAQAPSAALSPVPAPAPERDTDDDDIVCTGFKKAGE